MKIVKQSHKILHVAFSNAPFTPEQLIELCGRTCYKSEDKITHDSAEKFVGMIAGRGHSSVLEHSFMAVKFITNRGVTHEMVRHRIAAYSQESTRYVNYGGRDMQFIYPVWADEFKMAEAIRWVKADDESEEEPPDTHELIFVEACYGLEIAYNALLTSFVGSEKWRPEQAREVLPNALKTEIIMSANFREWMHVFKLRCSRKAHPQMRALMLPLYRHCVREYPSVFSHLLTVEE